MSETTPEVEAQTEPQVETRVLGSPLVAALVELVVAFHHVNCRGPSWETCQNPECLKVQEALR